MRYSVEQALQKLRHFCGYQERSHDEVKQKLYSLGLYKDEIEIAISVLIEGNYLNEERYAIAFAGGKFRMKQWGKVKIEYELKTKKVSAYNIKLALKSIEEIDYLNTLQALTQKKWESIALEDEKMFVKKSKITTYLLQRGFEKQLVAEAIASIVENES
ncbi:MAG: RecX family transcriptional regulator [Chitinophagaceae bacterium]|nr:RecX family transcriptional regulator [Chitinophagaceae bacterium]